MDKNLCVVEACRLVRMAQPSADLESAINQFRYASAWVRAPGESHPPSSGILLLMPHGYLMVLDERQRQRMVRTQSLKLVALIAHHVLAPTASIPHLQVD